MITATRPITSADVASHYNELDELYRAIWGEHLHHGLWETGEESLGEAVLALANRVAIEAEISEGMHVCDVGSGYGSTSILIAQQFGANVLGVTLSEKQCAIARTRSEGTAKFEVMNWLENDLPDFSFDAVLAIESTEHMVDKRRFFSEAFRVLAPCGRLVICAWCASDTPLANWQKKHLLEKICDEGRLPDLLTPTEYKNLFAETGFNFVKSDDLSPNVKQTWRKALVKTVRHFTTQPSQLRLLSTRILPSADFAKSLVRIAVAYETKAMQYILLKGTKR